MTATVHAIYPIKGGDTFDDDDYVSTHLPLVHKHFDPHGTTSITVSRGLAGGPDTPPGYFAVATMTFPDAASMGAALGAAGPVLGDIPNFATTQPDLLIGAMIA